MPQSSDRKVMRVFKAAMALERQVIGGTFNFESQTYSLPEKQVYALCKACAASRPPTKRGTK